MPIAHIHILEGRTEDQKRALISKVTQAIHEALNAPVDSIRIIIQDMPRENYGMAGVTAKDKGK